MQRLRTADWATGIAGVVLLVSLFAPWYGLSDGTVDGWRSLGFIDIWLLITAALAIAVVVVTATSDSPSLPVTFDVLATWAGLIATLMVLYRVISMANSEFVTGREWGLFLALLGALGVFAAAWRAMRDESQPGLRTPPEPVRMPAPPEHDPATPPT